MCQNTRRQIADKIDSFDKDKSLPFTEILDARMVEDALAAEGVKYNRSIYTPFVTLCTFLSQVLDPDHSCRAAVARVIVWLAIHDREPCSEQTGTYCDAACGSPWGSSGIWSGEPVGRSKAAPRRSGSGSDDACCWLTAPPRRCPIRPATKRTSPSRIPRPKGWGSR